MRSVVKCSVFAILICILSVTVGFCACFFRSVTMDDSDCHLYNCCCGCSCLVFLQSRDFINVHLLYIGLGLLFVGIFASGIKGAEIQFPLAIFRKVCLVLVLYGQDCS